MVACATATLLFTAVPPRSFAGSPRTLPAATDAAEGPPSYKVLRATGQPPLRAYSYRTRSEDFVFPGDLGGKRWGITEPDGCNHFSGNQARKWGPKFFSPAVAKVAKHEDGYADVVGATPYSLRRGGISLRLRAEDAQVVAKEAGTSLQMLDRSYAFAIDDLRLHGPRPADTEWREARAQAASAHGSVPASAPMSVSSSNSGATLSARRKSGLILPATSTLAKT